MFSLKFYARILGLVSFLSIFSCAEKEKKKAVVQENKPSEKLLDVLPSLPDKEMAVLFNQCDFIDYIFIDLPFSLSQNEKASIQQNVMFIENNPVKERMASCKPMARKFFKVQGNIVWEADVYAVDPCFYFVFYKDNKPMYANTMSANGKNFYNNLIKQAAEMGVPTGQ